MTKKLPKLSVLVPCYNVEKYVDQCLASIANQTLQDIEIICINDGSTDSTLDIIKKYADSDKRFVIIDKQNEGYGKSMNRGLDAATGEYIGIVESDDWIDADMFENLVKIADDANADVVKSNFFTYTTKNGEKNVLCKSLNLCPMNKVIKPMENTEVFFCTPAIWSAIYRRQFLLDNRIRFLESPGASYQDTGFNFKVWACAERAYLTPNAWLHYRCDNENSSVKSTGKVFCVCYEYDEIERFLDERGTYDNDMHKLVAYLKMRTYFWNLNRLGGDARTKFGERFASEFKPIISNRYLTHKSIDDRSWYKLMILMHPRNVFYRIMRGLVNLKAAFLKKRIYGKRAIYYLFGCVPVYNKKVNN